jgi:hypothetical protein
MKSLSRSAAYFALLVSLSAEAQDISLKWGLQNRWSYREEMRAMDEDAAVRKKTKEKTYRAFAFSEQSGVVEPMLKCFERHFRLWDRFKKAAAGGGGGKLDRQAFEQFKAVEDPACDQQAKKQAPVLYFDFTSGSKEQFVLETIEVTTLGFSEYKGGGFSKEEAWYDITLAHKPGKKRYDVARRLVFSETGRCELRLWSDNYYEGQGWIAPMGEYLIDIKFIFSAAGMEKSVSTGPFKIDV